MVNALQLRTKLFFVGTTLSLVPFIIIMATVFNQNEKVVCLGKEKASSCPVPI